MHMVKITCDSWDILANRETITQTHKVTLAVLLKSGEKNMENVQCLKIVTLLLKCCRMRWKFFYRFIFLVYSMESWNWKKCLIILLSICTARVTIIPIVLPACHTANLLIFSWHHNIPLLIIVKVELNYN